MQSRYITSVATRKQLKSFARPEIAFIGRSNSGKSSLINALLGRKNLAQTSSTPGRTRMINYYGWKNKGPADILIVDLPGFGYQKAPYHMVRNWNDLMAAYFQQNSVVLAIHLIDIRRKIEEEDWTFFREFYENKHTPLWVMLTKCDKVSTNQRVQQLQAMRKHLRTQFASPVIVSAVSAHKYFPMIALRQRLEPLAEHFYHQPDRTQKQRYLEQVASEMQQHDRHRLT